MQILHFADIHIGTESYGRTDPETGLSTRLQDALAAFDELVEYAIKDEIDLVLFCGDAYRSRDPSQTHQREFARRITRLSQSGIPIFLLVGNHDLPHAQGRASSLEIFGVLNVPLVTVGDRLTTYRIQTRAGMLQVVALPWPRRSALFAREEVRGLSLEQITQMIEQRLGGGIARAMESLDPSLPAVLAGHVMLSSATAGSERHMMLGQDHVLMPSSIYHPCLDYVALGHVHRHQVLTQLPLTAYAGSLQRVDFGEADDQKGFCVVELDPSKQQGRRLKGFKFVGVKSRPFVTIEVTIPPGDADPTATVLKRIEQSDIQDAIVRLFITAQDELMPLVRDGDIRAAFKEAHHVSSIRRETTSMHRARLAALETRSLSAIDMLDKYLEMRALSPARKAFLLERSRELNDNAELQPPGT
jgi:exonuclease SbcD